MRSKCPDKAVCPCALPWSHLVSKAASKHVCQAAGVNTVAGTRATTVLLDLKICVFCS